MARNMTPFRPGRATVGSTSVPLIENLLGALSLAPVLRELEQAPRMKVNIDETDQAYILTADVPGADREDITVIVDGNIVSITANVMQEIVEPGRRSISIERVYGEEYRTFSFLEPIDESMAEARVVNGVLALVLPKRTDTRPTRLDVRERSPEARYARGPSQGQPRTPAASSTVRFTLNGAEHSLQLESRVTLLDALREYAHLYGTKKGCDQGQCGACTVHVNGRRILSCLTLAAQVEGQEVNTIEGLAAGGMLHAMQDAFIRHDAFQCGYCTPGQIMSAIACINEGHAGSDAHIREYMSGNLCRCGAYTNIVAAIREVASAMGVNKEKAS